MQPTDRAEFTKLAEAMFGAFDKPPSEARMLAYWLGLAKMHLGHFEAAVAHVIGPEGEDELPTPKQLWNISRKLRNAQRAAELASRHPPPSDDAVELDRFDVYANRVLLAVLCSLTAQHGSAASDASLTEMVHVKHRYAAAYREMCASEPDASLDMRERLIAALTREFVPREPRPEFAARNTVPIVGETWNAAMASLATSNAIGGQNAPPDSPQWRLP